MTERWSNSFSFVVLSGAPSREEIRAKDLAVFKRARRASDELPGKVRQSDALRRLNPKNTPGWFPDHLLPGALLIDESRLLMTSMGSLGERLYAVPTASDSVCTITSGDVGAECVAFLHGPLTLNAHQTEPGGPLYAYGLLADGVIKLEIVAQERSYQAFLGENAYYCEIEGDVVASEISAVRVRYADGRSQTVSLDDPQGTTPSRG